MKQQIIWAAWCAFLILPGCKPESKSEKPQDATAAPTAAQTPAPAATPAAAPAHVSPGAAPVAAHAEQFVGSWIQVSGQGEGSTVDLKEENAFMATVKTGWKNSPEVVVAGEWNVQGDKFSLSLKVGDFDPPRRIHLPTTNPSDLPTTNPSDESSTPRHSASSTRLQATETDKIISVDKNSFTTLDQDGVTRTYHRVK